MQLWALALAVQALAPELDPKHTEAAIEAVRTVLANADMLDVATAFARALALTLPANPTKPYVAVIVDLLKWPTTAGPATDALLEVPHERVPEAPGKEAGLEATVAWVPATYPDIDLDSPPTYPGSAGTGSAP